MPGYYEVLKRKERARLTRCPDGELHRRASTFSSIQLGMGIKHETVKCLLLDAYDWARTISESFFFKFDVPVPDFQGTHCSHCKLQAADFAVVPCLALLCRGCACKSLNSCVLHQHQVTHVILMNKPFIGEWVWPRNKIAAGGTKKSLNQLSSNASTSKLTSTKVQPHKGIYTMDEFPGLKEKIFSTPSHQLLDFLQELKIEDIDVKWNNEDLAKKTCSVFLENMDTNYSIRKILNPSDSALCEQCINIPARIFSDECRHLSCNDCIKNDEDSQYCPICETELLAPQKWSFST